MTVRISLGPTMVVWNPYLDKWLLKIKHSYPKEVRMQVVALMRLRRFSLPESERMVVFYTSERK